MLLQEISRNSFNKQLNFPYFVQWLFVLALECFYSFWRTMEYRGLSSNKTNKELEQRKLLRSLWLVPYPDFGILVRFLTTTKK